MLHFTHELVSLKKTTAWRLVNGLSKPPADFKTQSTQFTHSGCARKWQTYPILIAVKSNVNVFEDNLS